MTHSNKKESIQQPPQHSIVAEVPCEYVTINLADGYKGWCRFFNTHDAKRAVLYLHGIQSHGGWFLDSINYLYQRGITVLAPDRRGSGMNTPDRGHCHSPNQLLLDLDLWMDWLINRTQTKQVDIVAVSWSGKWALVYAARHPDKVRSLTLVTPGLCAQVDINLREKIHIGVDGLLHPHRQHEIPLNEPTLFTTNPDKLAFIENDPLKLTHATASFFVTSTRLDMAVRRELWKISVPVYLFLAENDCIIDNQATSKLLRPVLEPINTCDPTGANFEKAKIYPNAHHTLDFEADPECYYSDLNRILVSPLPP